MIRLADDLAVNEDQVLYVIQPEGQRVAIMLKGGIQIAPPSSMTLNEVVDALERKGSLTRVPPSIVSALKGEEQEQEQAGEGAGSGAQEQHP